MLGVAQCTREYHRWMSTPSPHDLRDLAARFLATGLPRRLFELARDEDLSPDGLDLTSDALAQGRTTARALVVPRREGTLAGTVFIPELFRVFGGDLRVESLAADGAGVTPGEPVARLTGARADLLKTERTLLNLLGRLSGVATLTRRFVEAVQRAVPDKAPSILDTRKTTPGLRVLEKYAVACGGGRCHRLGLYDAVMLKDNHLAGLAPQEIRDLVVEVARRARARRPDCAFVEVEVDTIRQLEAVLTIEEGIVDIVLLDNMGPDQVRRCVVLRDRLAPRILLEASGGVTLESIAEIARTGVDRISVGALTHQATWLDLGLDFEA